MERAWFEEVPFPWHDPRAIELCAVLSEAYDDVRDIEHCGLAAGVTLATWRSGDGPARDWRSLINVAARQERVRALLDKVLADAKVRALHPALRALMGGDEQPPDSHKPHEPTLTSILIDRVLQWNRMVERCRAHPREHVLFLVHGSMEQDLHLFLRRIGSYLSDLTGQPHQVAKVERSRDGTTARTADEWKRCLVRGSRARQGELGFVLSQQAERSPGLFLFVDNEGPLRGLDPKKDLPALVDFLGQQVDPALLHLEARGQIKHPIRFVLPIEHPRSARSQEDLAISEIRRALGLATTLRLEALPPLEMPKWDEIEPYVLQEAPDADEALIAACGGLYDRVLGSRNATLQRLGDAIERAIIAWKQERFRRGRS